MACFLHQNLLFLYVPIGLISSLSILLVLPQVKLIFPATPEDLDKYRGSTNLFINETADLYRRVSKYHILFSFLPSFFPPSLLIPRYPLPSRPYIDSIPPSRVKWLVDIVQGQAEADAVLLRDDDPVSGFVLAKDWKWFSFLSSSSLFSSFS